jgi:sterol 3beta-glucosyltransferase
MMGFPRLPFPGYNRATYLLAEQLAWQMFRAVINRWRKQTLHLPPLPLTGYFHRLGTRQIPILNGFSPHVVPRPADWGEHVHLTGYWFPEDNAWQPPADLEAFLAAGKAPVFIGFGSMPIRQPAKTTAIILEALHQSSQRAVLQTGWGGLGQTELPAEVFQLDYAPYGWLFPRMAMVIHHGGSGTTAFGLRAGVPSLAVPFVFDQFYWGERIAALGVGPRPIRHSTLSVERLKEAILLGTTTSQLRQKAAELGDHIQAEKGLEQAISFIQQFKR